MAYGGVGVPATFVADRQYNANSNLGGQLTRGDEGNGVVSLYTYNDQRGFLSRILTTSGATTLLDQNYTRNAKGMITGVTSPDVGRSWTYSDLRPNYDPVLSRVSAS